MVIFMFCHRPLLRKRTKCHTRLKSHIRILKITIKKETEQIQK